MKRLLEINLDTVGDQPETFDPQICNIPNILSQHNYIIDWPETCKELGISERINPFFLNDEVVRILEEGERVVSIITDEGEINCRLIEEPEEWYDKLSEQLDDECINHKVSGTGTIYIYVGDEKLRIGDHDPNGGCYYDMDLDKVEEDFDEFVECIDNEDFEGLEKFMYKK